MDIMDEDSNLPGKDVKNQKTNEGEEFTSKAMDRISGLPDAVLRHALSFLSTKLAAQTGILSKRWKDVWVSVPVLDFEMRLWANFEGDTSVFDSFAKPRMESFMNFVDKLLAIRGDSRIRKFRLACDHQIDPQRFCTWISAMPDIEELDLEIWEPDQRLPWSHSLWKSLKVMKLNRVLLQIPSNTVSFPSLKTLNLNSVKYVGDKSIETLLSCCPILEDLQIIRSDEWDNIRNFVISVPTLKRLSLEFAINEMYLYDNEGDDDPEADIEYKLFVDAPNVEYLKIVDYMSDCIEVNSMPNVTESHVSVFKILECDLRTEEQHLNYTNNVCGLFQSIKSVKYLRIHDFTMVSLSDALDGRLPMFHNLVHLEMDLDGVDGAMLAFLEISPKLESLILPQGIIRPHEAYNKSLWTEENWKPPKNVPECLLVSLKSLEIRNITGEVEEELKILKYLLENAMVLEKMTIKCEEYVISGGGALDNMKERASDTCEVGDRFPFRDEMMNHIRGSAVCQLDIQLPQELYWQYVLKTQKIDTQVLSRPEPASTVHQWANTRKRTRVTTRASVTF